MKLWVCPEINGLDPAAADFDGAGHVVSLNGVAGSCQDECGEQLVEASPAWLKFYGLEEPEISE